MLLCLQVKLCFVYFEVRTFTAMALDCALAEVELVTETALLTQEDVSACRGFFYREFNNLPMSSRGAIHCHNKFFDTHSNNTV